MNNSPTYFLVIETAAETATNRKFSVYRVPKGCDDLLALRVDESVKVYDGSITNDHFVKRHIEEFLFERFKDKEKPALIVVYDENEEDFVANYQYGGTK